MIYESLHLKCDNAQPPISVIKFFIHYSTKPLTKVLKRLDKLSTTLLRDHTSFIMVSGPLVQLTQDADSKFENENEVPVGKS